MTSPARRAAYSFLIARVNAPHIQLAEASGRDDMSALTKLMQKADAYLKGELKSEANLQRFHEAFCQWREQQPAATNLNDSIIELINSALYATVEMLFDGECDDTPLLTGAVNELYADMEAAGTDTQEMIRYFNSLSEACDTVVSDNASRPLPAAYFDLLQEADASLFGLAR
ncbi:MAG: hypothetical protein CMI02_03705 [Oceanospirillaceae bacterium]|nr:hypothetical protein [Oceanospirillaceae bacterium]MBT11124.1 hypothetical protein [Oceanospirillaceae bacterium]